MWAGEWSFGTADALLPLPLVSDAAEVDEEELAPTPRRRRERERSGIDRAEAREPEGRPISARVATSLAEGAATTPSTSMLADPSPPPLPLPLPPASPHSAPAAAATVLVTGLSVPMTTEEEAAGASPSRFIPAAALLDARDTDREKVSLEDNNAFEDEPAGESQPPCTAC